MFFIETLSNLFISWTSACLFPLLFNKPATFAINNASKSSTPSILRAEKHLRTRLQILPYLRFPDLDLEALVSE